MENKKNDLIVTSMINAGNGSSVQGISNEMLSEHKEELKRDWKHWYKRFMILLAVLSQGWLIVQLVSMCISQETRGLSMLAFILYDIGNILWFIYAWFVLTERNYVLIIQALMGFVVSTAIIIGIAIFQKQFSLLPEPRKRK